MKCGALPQSSRAVSSGGLATSEMSRRIGAAHKDLDPVCNKWDFARITKPRKLRKDSGSLPSHCLVECVEMSLFRRVVDTYRMLRKKQEYARGQEAGSVLLRCLEGVSGIEHEVSRISGETVLQEVRQQKLSTTLLHRELLPLETVESKPTEDIIRKVSLQQMEIVYASGLGRKAVGDDATRGTAC